MPAISKIRFTNAVYDNGEKRYNDEVFEFDGHNGAILLENGGGKTTFIQIAIQAILPHADLGARKIRDTLLLEGNPCHIAIEWIINESPRRYALTAVTLFLNNGKLDSYRYVYEYGYNDKHSIENIPFTRNTANGNRRPSSREEMGDYYHSMAREYINAKTFSTVKEYHQYIEENFKIIPKEWRRIAVINGEEGGVHKFFEDCKTTENLVDRLLIPVAEEAIEGKGTEDFIDNFEEQREHFKKHKYLKETIDESKEIQKRVNEYVNIYGEYHEEEKKLYNKKSFGKGLYQYIYNEKEDIIAKLEENRRSQEEYEYELRELNRMEKSYELVLLEEKLLLSKDKYERILKDYEIHKEQLDDKEARLQNLNISKIKRNIRRQKEEIKQFEAQLEGLEKDEEIANIEKELAINSSRIKGYYQREIDNLNRKAEALDDSKMRYEEQLKEYKKNKEELEKRHNEIKKSYIELNRERQIKEKHMEGIKKRILSNPETEKIEEEYPKWTSKVAYNEKQIMGLQENIKYLSEEKSKLNLQLINHREELFRFSSERDTLKEKINNIEEHERELLISLKESIPNLYYISSLYTKKEQILSTLENKSEILKKEKENLLIEERISHRFIDDYKDTQYFTAEPLLSKWVNEWSDQFSFLELGSKYIERVAKEEREIQKYYKEYPYWVMAAVVADNEEEKLKSKLEDNIDKIIYPIMIITQSRAQEILRGKGVYENDNPCIYPSMWETNILRSNFNKRKCELEEKANKISKNRKEKEKEYGICNNLLARIREFLNKYPYNECLRPLKDGLKDVEESIYFIKEAIDRKDERIKEIDDELLSITKEIQELTMESNSLNNRIEKALEYMNENKEVYEIQKKTLDLKHQILKREKEISEITDIIDDIGDRIRNIDKMLESIRFEKNALLKDELYKEVKNSPPLEPDKIIEVLKMERRNIKDRLGKRQKNRRDIEENKMRAEKLLEEYEMNLKNEVKAAKFPIEEIEFPPYGDREIDDLLDEIKILSSVVDGIKAEVDEARFRFRIAEDDYNKRESDFYKEFDSIVKFTEALEIVKKNIMNKRKELDKRNKYLKSMEENLKKELKSIEEALELLRMKNERYEYLAEKVEESLLPEGILKEIPYNRVKYVNLLAKDLEEISKRVKEKFEEVSKKKSEFEQFCNSRIKDSRLKYMAISGIDHKDSFQELNEWKRIMDKRIENSIRVLEEDLMEHDKQIKQFITHIHSYLKTVAEEIRNMSKKTRIKVEDKWKEVYTIDVPEWKDEVGKQKLIDYINYLLKEIEDNRFKDEDGNEDKVSVKRFIDNRFQCKELLKVVMGNERIKVKCRKVTNDGKVSSIPVSWSKSNNWSGGEKWSKNMTLFLGILNYLAEKSQSIQPSQKRNRTVILDNPFGEASSDHVLSPVFFIAERLGFQIIALTAHSEGKYIRDFFPVVYSCRLRPSKDSETQVVTKEKAINYAYLRENDPRALMRLGEREQLTMF